MEAVLSGKICAQGINPLSSCAPIFAASSWRAALWAAIGSALALFLALVFGASGAGLAHGLYIISITSDNNSCATIKLKY